MKIGARWSPWRKRWPKRTRPRRNDLENSQARGDPMCRGNSPEVLRAANYTDCHSDWEGDCRAVMGTEKARCVWVLNEAGRSLWNRILIIHQKRGVRKLHRRTRI